jgi:hypothetical protein
MPRSGRDHDLGDHVRPALLERSSHDGNAHRSRSGATARAGHNELPMPADLRGPEAAGAVSPRQPYREPDRNRQYSLRDSELGTLVDIATFRAVTLDDLTLCRYGGDGTQTQQEKEIAHQQGLTVVSGKIPVPDLQVEYEAPERELAKMNLELATAHYHRGGLAAKARAGFAIYALSEDAAPLHRALQDSGLMKEILSL